MGYVLDTSALVDAWTKWYSMRSIPRFWDNLERLARDGQATMPDAVMLELHEIDDDLHRWCKAREAILVTPTSQDIQAIVTDIANAYPNLRHTGPPGANFADPVVIALAEHRGFANLNGPRIPDVCRARRIRPMQVHHLVQEEGWTFD